ncbi:inositol monophosphatase [Formicincola oecophyllae]|uniref:Inositol-1-monophosphatase n=1 Tax=Formicincola oecophyllae TaxID=2558361 RepID=A0A4Y6U9D4_9PROT|nr:inositol monophosphatase family protein [Formicincola oecophyllae]QDH13066.1 inositol monophosphatase [Formicincola oecophyllae]
MRLSPHMAVMQAAARKAAKGLLRDFAEVEQLQVSIKGPGDFVSQADRNAEKIIHGELARARQGYAFLMEESGRDGGENWDWRWIVDPLDGTTNFLHGIPHWAISIALQRRDKVNNTTEIVSGLIYNPVNDEMFWCEKGQGAFLNNERRIRVSNRRKLSEALFGTGIPFAKTPEATMQVFGRTLGALMPKVAGIRRFGAAALDLAWVAAGRFDGFWELGLKPWDCAAGLLMVREAGGYATDESGDDLGALDGDVNVIAGNPHFQPALRDLVAQSLVPAAQK